MGNLLKNLFEETPPVCERRDEKKEREKGGSARGRKYIIQVGGGGGAYVPSVFSVKRRIVFAGVFSLISRDGINRFLFAARL